MRAFSVAEKRLQVAAAMHDAKDQRVLFLDIVNDDILPHGHAAASGAEIFVAGTSDIGEAGKPSAKKRAVMVSTNRLAISILRLSFAT